MIGRTCSLPTQSIQQLGYRLICSNQSSSYLTNKFSNEFWKARYHFLFQIISSFRQIPSFSFHSTHHCTFSANHCIPWQFVVEDIRQLTALLFRKRTMGYLVIVFVLTLLLNESYWSIFQPWLDNNTRYLCCPCSECKCHEVSNENKLNGQVTAWSLECQFTGCNCICSLKTEVTNQTFVWNHLSSNQLLVAYAFQ